MVPGGDLEEDFDGDGMVDWVRRRIASGSGSGSVPGPGPQGGSTLGFASGSGYGLGMGMGTSMEGGQGQGQGSSVTQGLESTLRETTDDTNLLPTHVKIVRALTLVQLGLARRSDQLGPLPGDPSSGGHPSMSSPLDALLRASSGGGDAYQGPQSAPTYDHSSPSPFDAYYSTTSHFPAGPSPSTFRDFYAPATGGYDPRPPEPSGAQMTESEYATLISLLASALGDVLSRPDDRFGVSPPPPTRYPASMGKGRSGEPGTEPEETERGYTPATPVFSDAPEFIEGERDDGAESRQPATKLQEMMDEFKKMLSADAPKRPLIKRRHSVDSPNGLAHGTSDEAMPWIKEVAESDNLTALWDRIIRQSNDLVQVLRRYEGPAGSLGMSPERGFEGSPAPGLGPDSLLARLGFPAPHDDGPSYDTRQYETERVGQHQGRSSARAHLEDDRPDLGQPFTSPIGCRAGDGRGTLTPLRCCLSDQHCPHAGRAENERRARADPSFNRERSPMLRLPPELQRRILREARTLSEDASAWVPPPDTAAKEEDPAKPNGPGGSGRRKRIFTPVVGGQSYTTMVTGPGIIYNLPSSHDPYNLGDLPAVPQVQRPKGGRRVAQEYAHSLATVCTDLLEISRTSAWETVHIRTRRQIQTLVTLWRGDFDDYEDRSLGKRTGSQRSRAARMTASTWPLEDCSPLSSVASFDSFVIGPDPIPRNDDAPVPGPDEEETVDAVQQDKDEEGLPKVDAGADTRKEARRGELKEAGRAVRRLNIEVPAATGDNEKDKDSARRPPRRTRRRRNVYHQGLRTAPDLAASLAELQHSRKAAAEAESQQLPLLFSMTPNLQELVLCINPARGSTYPNGGLNGHGFGFEGFGCEILDALCSLHALRSLTLKSGIDFSELEVLLPHLNELTELRLEGGLDSVDGRGDVDPDLHHRCRLQTFTLQNLDFDGDVSAEQLCWILAQSVGHLEHLDLIVYAGGGPGHNAWLNGGAPGANAAFACKTFADLLVQLGPTLRHLALRDCSSFGSVHHDLNQPPHSGYLDYALLHCSKLDQLAIEWFVTGPALLDCLSADRDALEAVSDQDDDPDPSGDASLSHIDLSPRPLQTLTFFGSPERTSAKRMMAAINKPEALPRLKSVTLAAFPSQRSGQQVPWATRDLRKLRDACQEKKVWLSFA